MNEYLNCNPMNRIFVGTRDIANTPSMLQQGLQTLGYHSVARLKSNNPFYSNQSDPKLVSLFQQVRETINKTAETGPLESLLAPYLEYDCYLFVTESLLPGMLDLPILRKLGKKVVFLSTGSDVRYSHAAKAFNRHFGVEFPQSLLSPLHNDYSSQARMALQDVYRDRYSNKLNNTRMAEVYANSYIGSPRSLHFAIAPYFAVVAAADTSGCKARIPNRTVPKVLHCPSKKSFKQTDRIIEALHELKEEGLRFDFELTENLPHPEILSRLSDADVLIDQLFPGKSALLGLEAMASGCAVVGCNTESAMPVPFRIQPIVGINQHNLKQRLRLVLSNKALRYQLAEAGLAYTALGIHEPHNVARYYLDTLERARNQKYDYYPTYFFEHCQPPKQEVVPEYLRELNWRSAQQFGVPADFDSINRYSHIHFPANICQRHLASLPRWPEANDSRSIWGWWSEHANYPHTMLTGAQQKVANELAMLSAEFDSEASE